jgi:type IV secretion system protein VirB5
MNTIDTDNIARKEGLEPGSAMDEYIAARRTHEEADWPLRLQNRNLLYLSIASMTLAAAALVFAAVTFTRKPADHFYAFSVDKAANIYSLGTPISDTKGLPEIAKEHLLRQWIMDARDVITEWPAQIQLVRRVTAQAKGPALTDIDAYYNDNRPDTVAKTHTIAVDVTSILLIGEHTYDVEWKESSYALDGTLEGTSHWRGRFTTSLQPPDTPEKQNPLNPLGFYITNYNWSKTNA